MFETSGKIMKRTIIILTIAAASISGCSNRSTLNDTKSANTVATTTTIEHAPSICIKAMHSTELLFGKTTEVIGVSGNFFSAVGNLDFDTASAQTSKLNSIIPSATSLARESASALEDCKNSDPPSACISAIGDASEAAGFFQDVLQGIITAMEGLSNMDVSTFEDAARSIESARDPLVNAQEKFSLDSQSCINS